MHLMPILYVTDVDGAIDFLAAFGFEVRQGAHRDDMWAELEAGDGATLALHHTASLPDDPSGREGRLQLTLRTTEQLEDLMARLRDEHDLAPASDIVEQDFGRLVVYEDPDGFEIDVVKPPS